VKTVGLWDALKTRTFKSRETALPYTFDMPDVAYGRHAIAIDELRTRFRTNKWKMPDGDRHQQVWFAGVHSDVGGGYPEAGLSDLALRWMAEGAASREMLVDRAALDAISGEPTASAHDSIGGMWKLLGGKPRTIPPGAWVHESVQRRVEAGIALATTPPPDAKYVS